MSLFEDLKRGAEIIEQLISEAMVECPRCSKPVAPDGYQLCSGCQKAVVESYVRQLEHRILNGTIQ